MIVKATNPIVPTPRIDPVTKSQGIAQPQQPSKEKEDQQQLQLQAQNQANNNFVGSDPFVQQIRTITDEALQSNPSLEINRSDNNRVRTGLEGKSDQTLQERPYNQIFERERNTPAIENSQRKDLELPPAERQYNGRDKEQTVTTQIKDENDTGFTAFEAYAPKPDIDLNLGFYRHETEIEQLDAIEQDLARYPKEILPPKSTRAAFAQAKDEDFQYLPASKKEQLQEPLPTPLVFSKNQTDALNNSTERMATYGAQPPQESTQATIRTNEDQNKPPIVRPDTSLDKQLQSIEPAPASAVAATPIPTLAEVQPIQANVSREAPVTETSESTPPKGSFEQMDDLLSGSKQLRREDQIILGEGATK